MNECLSEYYRCPDNFSSFELSGPVSDETGYFQFGANTLYGKISAGGVSRLPRGPLRNVLPDCSYRAGSLSLPFNPTEVLNDLRFETYAERSKKTLPATSMRGRAYYFVRPILPVRFRKHLQKIRLNGWQELQFPSWPVDTTVEDVLERLLLLSLRMQKEKEIPFIWFWPNGASSCALMTHDVETASGRDFCASLMDINDAYGIKASFQVVPERRYDVPRHYLDSMSDRGFEINVQDLNHDGHLFRDQERFLARARKINEYGRQFGAKGFRAAVLYRRQEWFQALEFSYDTSVPNVAHLDPQRGGCCTVMPYFIGNLVELPVTTTQDYMLFHILEKRSIELWKQQIDLIMSKNGLMTFIVHPDYIIDREELTTYKNLLSYLAELKANKNVWMPLPWEAAYWWKQRANMKLIQENGAWRIDGEGSDRATVAYATEQDGNLVYSFESAKLLSEAPGITSRTH